MRIVIIGAGAVGSYLAERLSVEGQDIVVIESDGERAEEVQRDIDALVIHGNGASPAVLEEAGLSDADLVIAVTSSDAVNLLACHAANRFGVPRTVARVEDPALRDETEELGVDFIIDPEEAAARELFLILRQGGVSELFEFAEHELVLVGGYIDENADIVGTTLAELRQMVSGWNWLVVAIIRDGETLIARGSTVIEAHDHVLLMSKANRTEEAFRLLGLKEHPAEKVIILGSTRLAQLTAEIFTAAGVTTILIDEDEGRCRIVAEQVPKAITVLGDPTDPKVLKSEDVENADAVIALTGWDDVNMLGCLVAKALGVPTAVARFHRFDLVKILPGVGIDATVSSRLAGANEILRFVRRGRIHSVTTFHDSDAEAIELVVGEDSPAVGKTLADLHLPHTLIVGGVRRDHEAFVPRGNTVVEPGDTLIVIALPEGIPYAEKLSG